MGGYERERLWRALRFTPIALDDPRIERLMAVLCVTDTD